MHAEVERWAGLLDASASAADRRTPPGLAPWFLHARGIIEAPAVEPTSLDDVLWLAVARGSSAGRLIDELISQPGSAPLVAYDGSAAIEVWTERDLSAMHAMSRLLDRAGSGAGRDRLDSAVLWHLENTQPDNATGRPWALHVFALRWIENEDADARLYAETLLHNCQVLDGRPDPLSGEILRDSAEAMRASMSKK